MLNLSAQPPSEPHYSAKFLCLELSLEDYAYFLR